MENINLDFLSSPPRLEQQTERLPTPIATNRFSNVLSKKHKRLNIAEKIANVDALVREIERFKLDNNELKCQLKDFQKTAADVQSMYSEEKQNHESVKKDLEQLKQKYDKIDIDLANKNMVYYQLSARLAEYESRPIDYDSLVVKFVKIMQKLEGEDFLRYSKEKNVMDELKQYCIKMKLKIPIIQSPKKGRCRAVKPKIVSANMQCSDLRVQASTHKPVMKDQYTQSVDTRLEMVNEMKENLSISRPELRDQFVQCQVARRDQASQYISTMITRQTNTEKITQKHVSTMFPEPKPTPPINDILNVFCKWADIKSITPLDHSPKSNHSKKVSKSTTTTIGTCTMLCNIRRKIDYLSSFAPGIKQELTTPSPSPTPSSNSASDPCNNPTTASVHANMGHPNLLPKSLLTLFNVNSNSALGQLTTAAFNELWQMFGTMLLSLLHTSNAGIANINQNSINQQQFLDWLLELYMNSQLSPNTSTQSVSQQVNSTQTAPLRFDESSVLSSASIVRPQVKKTHVTGTENNVATPSESLGGNNSQFIAQQNTVINATPILTDDNNSQVSNSLDVEIKGNIVEARADDICKRNYNQFIKTRKISKKSRKNANNDKLLDNILELLPEAKLNKKKRKDLKRLLKKPKNKSFENKRIEILMNQDVDNEHNETAVEFVTKFSQHKGEFENVSILYTENQISTQNSLIENIEYYATKKEESNVHTENLPHCTTPVTSTRNDDFTFVKPAVSQSQNYQHKLNSNNGTFVKPAKKQKKFSRIIEKKYKMLFGDSDNELDEEDEISKRHKNTVINGDFKYMNENSVVQTSESCKYSLDVIKDNCIKTTEFKNTTSPSQKILTDKSYTTADGKHSLTNILDQTSNNIFVEQFSIPEISPFKSPLYPVFNEMQQKETAIEKHSEIQASLTEFETSGAIAKDLELSSDDETTSEKSYHQMQIELLPTNEAITPINERNTENFNNVEFVYDTHSSLLATNKTSSTPPPDMDFKYNTVAKYDCRENLENTQTKSCEKDNNIETFKRNASIDSFKATKTPSQKIFTDKSYTIADDKHSLTNILDQTSNNIFVEQFSIPEISPFKNPLYPVFNELQQKETATEKHSEIQPSLTEFETSAAIAKDFELSSDDETTSEKSYHQMEIELLPTNNEIYTLETDLKKHHEAITSINERNTENCNNVEFIYNTHSSLLATNKTSSSPPPDMDFKYTTVSRYDCGQNLENAQTKSCEKGKNIETFKRNTSIDSLKATKTHPSVFEKDLELSSDNEDNDNQFKNESKPTYKLESNPSVDSLSESEGNNSPTNSQYVFDNDVQVARQNIEQELKCEEEKVNLHEIASSNPPLANFNVNTFSQNSMMANSEHLKTLPKKQNVLESELSTINERDELKSTANTLSWSVQTMSNQTTRTDNSSISSICDNDEISIIEISTDVTDLDHEQELENDLIIDEDYYDGTSENSNFSRNNSPADIHYTLVGEDHNYSKTKLNDSSKTENLSRRDDTNNDDTLNSSTISTLLNSTLYNELLTDSICPIVNDLLEEDVVIKTPPQVIRSKRGRKRKSECPAVEVIQPCKRSSRLMAKQMILEQSFNISEIPIEIGKYTQSRRNANRDFKPINVKETTTKTNSDAKKNDFETDLKNNLSIMPMGFFLESRLEEGGHKNEYTLDTDKNDSYCENVLEEQDVKTTEQNHINIEHDIEIASLTNSIKTSGEIKVSEQTNDSYKAKLNEAFCEYYESPKSPAPVSSNYDLLQTTYTTTIPLDRPLPQQIDATLFDTLINSYSIDSHRNIQPNPPAKDYNRHQQLLQQLQTDIEMYCNSDMELDLDHTAYHLLNKLLKKTDDYDLIQKATLNVAQMAESLTVPEMELPSIIQELPPRHLGRCLQRLFVILRHFLNRNANFCQELIYKIEKLLFATQNVEKLSLQATLNLTQLYLSACKQQESLPYVYEYKHPGRLFIAKCLYYYNKKAVLMVHEVLLWYPTVLPHREDKTYDRSDALITVIQEILMNTRYEMDNQQLRGKSLISKLRYEYHYEVYSPTLDEVIVNLVDKLKNSKFYNISMAFGLLCKRLQPEKVQQKILNAHLLPLSTEYYNKALLTVEYDKRISVLLELVSMIVKPFPVDSNVDVYLNEFSRFLNCFNRPLIQEAALCSILRLQRFGYVNCFNCLQHFKATFDLDTHTQAMLKTFLYRKPLTFWKTIKSQNPRNNY